MCGINGKLVVVGGCDAWNCINTVEEYDPITNRWRYILSMASCRRGTGMAVFKGKHGLLRSDCICKCCIDFVFYLYSILLYVLRL